MLIAPVQDSQGMVAGNEVLYTNAFGNLDADVLYRNTVEGLEQFIIFREGLPDPAAYGLDPNHTVVQCLTEFFSPPIPAKFSAQVDGAENDLCLDFKDMVIGVGDAFIATGGHAKASAGTVRKYWGKLENRDFLIEELPYSQITNVESGLALHASNEKPRKRTATLAAISQGREGRKTSGLGKLLSVNVLPPHDGLVVDYGIMNSTNYAVFQGDTTYFVSGIVDLSGTSVFEGGAVIKYASSTFSVESIAWDLELAGHEVEHGEKVFGGAVAAGFALGGGEKAV